MWSLCTLCLCCTPPQIWFDPKYGIFYVYNVKLEFMISGNFMGFDCIISTVNCKTNHKSETACRAFIENRIGSLGYPHSIFLPLL